MAHDDAQVQVCRGRDEPVLKMPAGAGVSGIAVAGSAAGLAAATVNPLPVSAATAAAVCTGTMAVRFVVAG